LLTTWSILDIRQHLAFVAIGLLLPPVMCTWSLALFLAATILYKLTAAQYFFFAYFL
jgi:hypothetical protein